MLLTNDSLYAKLNPTKMSTNALQHLKTFTKKYKPYGHRLIVQMTQFNGNILRLKVR